MSLYVKRLEAGKFIWPSGNSGEAVQISAAQLGYLLEGIDWRNPRWTQRPAKAGQIRACPHSVLALRSYAAHRFKTASWASVDTSASSVRREGDYLVAWR